jgi:hypothetical protein
MWVAIHKCMEAMLGIFLHLYPKTICLSYYLLSFLFNKSGEEGRTGSAWKWEVGGMGRRGVVAQTMCTYVSKCKNDKRRKEKKKMALLQ